jgi:hypothetical protein
MVEIAAAWLTANLQVVVTRCGPIALLFRPEYTQADLET